MSNTAAKDFFRYAALNVLGMLGLSCYILADTFFISKGLGASGLAALNLAIPVYSFIHGTGLMLGTGGGTRFSIARGQGKAAEGCAVFTHTLLLYGLFTFLFLAVGLPLTDSLTEWLGADSITFPMCRTYIGMLFLFSPFFLLNELILGFVRNDGAPRLAMTAMLTGSFLNILLDYIFIFPLGLGIFGAVLATGLAPVASLLVLSRHFTKKRNTFRPIRLTFSRVPDANAPISLRKAAGILTVGVPSLVTELSGGVVMIVFNKILLNLAGNDGVAAYGVIANLSLVVIAIYTGIAQGAQPILSERYGREDNAGIRSCGKLGFLTVLLLSLLLYGGIALFAEGITALFNSEGNAALQTIAVDGLRLYFLGGTFAGVNIFLSTLYTSTGREISANLLSLLRGFLLILPFAALFSALWKLTGLWLVFPGAESVSLLLVLLWTMVQSRLNPASQSGIDRSR